MSIRFDNNVPVSSLWKMAESLIDFGGSARKIVFLNNKTNKALFAQDNAPKLSWGSFALKIAAIALAYLTVIGGAIHLGTLLYNRYKHELIQLPLTDPYFMEDAKNTYKDISTSTPENYAEVLADKKNPKEFDKKEIEFMKSLKLKNMNYEIPGNYLQFTLKNSETLESMEFSDRIQSNGELRGKVLRDLLDKYRDQNPELTLYDAIAKIVTSTDSDLYQLFVRYRADGNEEKKTIQKCFNVFFS